jgi:F-type H+-transporting ATPase subunit epsilon
VYTKDFTVEIVTPIEKKFEGTVQEIILPGIEGEMAVLAGHSPLLTMLSNGVTVTVQGNERTVLATGEGFATIAENKVVCLVDFATDVKDLDFVAIAAELETVRAALQAAPGEVALRVKKDLLEGKMKAQGHGK